MARKPAAPLVVEMVEVGLLDEYSGNPRTHSDAQVREIAASITRFGWTNPILVDRQLGIVAGHGRKAAAVLLGMSTVPVIRLGALTKMERRALILADNKLALNAGWNADLLAFELGALRDVGFDLSLTGFSPIELGGILGGGLDGRTDPDAVPEVPEVPVSRTGDVWLLGRHRLVCGDCTDGAVLDAVLDGAKPALCLTDPPYGIGESYDQVSDTKDALADLVAAFLPLVRARCDAVLLTPGNSNQPLYPVPDWTLAWFVPAGIGRSPWGFSCWQPIMAYGRDPYLRAGRGARPDALIEPGAPPLPDDLVLQDQFVLLPDAIVHTEAADNKLGHPCPKPIKVWSYFLKRGAPRIDAVVLDPFSGAGTTIIAAELTNRIACAVEISPGYVDVAVRRWQGVAGVGATLEADGATFDDVARARANEQSNRNLDRHVAKTETPENLTCAAGDAGAAVSDRDATGGARARASCARA